MTLKEQLSADMLAAMKAKDTFKRDSLRVVIGEVNREQGKLSAGEVMTDSDIQKIITKSVKNLEIMATDEAKQEIGILEVYLPKQLKFNEVQVIISQICQYLNATSIKDMGKVMAEFKSQFDGQADGKLVSTIIKEKLS